MLKRVFAFLVRLAVLGVILYSARAALKKWVDGPEPSPTSGGWTAPSGAPPAPAGAQASPGGDETPVDPLPTWVSPDATGGGPSTHPVKVKMASKVYRDPGAPGYDRCRADRYYTSVAAAEADGFTRAKR